MTPFGGKLKNEILLMTEGQVCVLSVISVKLKTSPVSVVSLDLELSLGSSSRTVSQIALPYMSRVVSETAFCSRLIMHRKL